MLWLWTKRHRHQKWRKPLTIPSLVVPLIAILGGACGTDVIDAVHQLRMVQKLGRNLTTTHGTTAILIGNALKAEDRLISFD